MASSCQKKLRDEVSIKWDEVSIKWDEVSIKWDEVFDKVRWSFDKMGWSFDKTKNNKLKRFWLLLITEEHP